MQFWPRPHARCLIRRLSLSGYPSHIPDIPAYLQLLVTIRNPYGLYANL